MLITGRCSFVLFSAERPYSLTDEQMARIRANFAGDEKKGVTLAKV